MSSQEESNYSFIIGDKKFEEFIDDLNDGSVLAIILRAHLYIESKLLRLLELSFKRPKELDLNKMNFSMKVKLLAAMDVLTIFERESINNLNKIRNKLAHDLNYEVSQDDIEDLLKFEHVTRKQLISTLGSNDDLLLTLRALLSFIYVDLEYKITKYENGEHLTDQF
ncbi:hypothetical protein [Halalkalibacter alkalisediminis]|uniref:DUF4145 domain-containing protein n=1 Tax=Halalkalibacter alkalisediminis TaxID=935616 RepID=A0ABV6NG34_9BACI|nr:hypothetical protein [Halalkalibacter alkalisediminis]